MLFGEYRDVKLSVVGKIVRAIASTICQPEDNFTHPYFPQKANLSPHANSIH